MTAGAAAQKKKNDRQHHLGYSLVVLAKGGITFVDELLNRICRLLKHLFDRALNLAHILRDPLDEVLAYFARAGAAVGVRRAPNGVTKGLGHAGVFAEGVAVQSLHVRTSSKVVCQLSTRRHATNLSRPAEKRNLLLDRAQEPPVRGDIDQSLREREFRSSDESDTNESCAAHRALRVVQEAVDTRHG